MNIITVDNKVNYGHTIKSKRPKANNCIKSKHHNIIASFEMFDWTKAEYILNNFNNKNRTVSEIVVFNYKDDMIQNNWRSAGDPIVFDINNDLIDGQHRLLAIVTAHNQGVDITQEFLVIRGVSTDCYKYKDIGRKRSAGEAIEMAGKRNEIHFRDDIKADVLSSAIKHATKFSESRYQFRDRESLVKTVDSYKTDYIGLDNSVFLVSKIKKKNNIIGLPVGQIAAMHYFLAKKDANMADEFIAQLMLGSNIDEDHVIYQIIAPNSGRIAKMKKDTKIDRSAPFGYMITAWNAIRSGNPYKKLRFTSDYDKKPFIPEIV